MPSHAAWRSGCSMWRRRPPKAPDNGLAPFGYRRLRARLPVVFLVGILAQACHDRLPTQPIPSVITKGADAGPDLWSTDPEAVALGEVVRSVALALRNDAVRDQVKRDMRRAPFREHKLNLRTYLESGAGSSLLARVPGQRDRTPSEWLALVRTVRPLEFYMPVEAHRETWTGSGDVFVASQIRDSDPILAYDTRGERVYLSVSAPPSTPTFVIVPAETDFTKPVDATRAVNVNDAGGQAIGTLSLTGNATGAQRYIAPDEGSSGSSSPSPAGLYLTFSRLEDLGEPWTKGNPEIEVHIHGPTQAGSSQYGADLACAGEHAAAYRRFDQNGPFWSGSVLLFTAGQVDDYNLKFNDGFNVLFWEDDDTACTIKTDKDMLKGTLQATAQAFGGAAVKLLQAPNWVTALGVFVGFLYDSADWLLSNDDYLGSAIEKSATGHAWSDASHTIVRGSGVNGRAKLEWK